MQALEQMYEFNRKNDKKATYRKMQLHQLKNPSQVFCPSEKLFEFEPDYIRNFMLAGKGLKLDALNDVSEDLWRTWVYGTWRNTLRVFNLDESLQRQSTAIPDDTPSMVFSNLPDWCVYVSIPNPIDVDIDTGQGNKIIGFWAVVDSVWKHPNNHELNVLLDTDGGFVASTPIKIALEEGMTVNESINKLWFEYDAVKTKDMPSLKVREGDKKYMSDLAKKLLGLLLWVCVEEPDVSNIAGEPMTGEQLRLPAYRKNKKGIFVPPNHPTVIEVGKRLGNQLREFEQNITQDGRVSSRKRPHIRKGHWHGVWCGTGQNKRFKTYWQPAVFVNAVV